MTGELIAVEMAADVAKEAMQCFKEYAMCREQEITERKRIRAQLEAINCIINANKEICLKQIETRADERKQMYDSVQVVINKAAQDNDIGMLKTAFDFMLTVYQNAPQINEINLNLLEKKDFI